MIYLWLKAFHIIFMVAWFAGMFYIWRLFVYHMENPNMEVKNQLTIMEKRLYTIIMMPAMILTVLFGIFLLIYQWEILKKQYWIWLKLIVIVILLYWHFLAGYYIREFQKGKEYSSKRFRVMNEVPTLILIVVVILAILKPF